MMCTMLKVSKFLASLKDCPPLLFRLALAYGYYGAASHKFHDIASVGTFFTALGIPAGPFMAYFVAGLEAIGVPLLILGLATRWISTLLFTTMLVAIFVAHIPYHEDFSMALWYVLGLFSLMVTGGGRYSLDRSCCPCEKALSCCSSRPDDKKGCGC